MSIHRIRERRLRVASCFPLKYWLCVLFFTHGTSTGCRLALRDVQDSGDGFAGRGSLLLLLLVTAHSATAAAAPAARDVACATQKDAASCDADGDAIPDGVEVVVCGSGTCATGREDTDADGIPDWTEVTACGDVKCANPLADADADGVPDYAEDLAVVQVSDKFKPTWKAPWEK